MQTQLNRRSFLAGVASASATSLVPRRGRALMANEQIHIGCVGVGGKGWSDMIETSVGHKIVAICDVDELRLAKASERFPNAKRYTDWRRLLQQPGVDAVTVSTPDHTHAPVTFCAIGAGKHTYTQKPLTHSVHEARKLSEAAQDKGVVTQMGIQHHSNTFFKTAVRLIHDSAIGRISEAHVWTDRPVGFWKQGISRPGNSSSAPKTLNWDQWLGVAPERPFVNNAYHPFHWRAYWDFGTGALGDMGCHGMDPVVTALELGPPKLIWPTGPRPNDETGPTWSIINYDFPGTSRTESTCRMTWYDGAKLPPRELFKLPREKQLQKNGILFIGSKGQLLVDYFSPPVLLPQGDFADTPIEAAPVDNHYTQWTDAIIGLGQTSCPFSYSGPLSETVLLGNVAVRTGRRIRWNADRLECIDDAETSSMLRRNYRSGWDVPGLS